ncbi:MAG: Maf family protein [Armatimonadota bacterium]
MRRIVLASESVRRRELMELMGLEFEVCPSGLDEDSAEFRGDAAGYVRELARAKARAVADRVRNGLVVGADTAVVVDDEVLGKPKDRDDAVRMLRLLVGRAHKVFSGIAVLDICDGVVRAECVDHVETEVRMRAVGDDVIRSYVDSGEPMDKAGAYAIQGLGSVLVEGIVGDYYNVVGLPVCRLSMMLEAFGVQPMISSGKGVCRRWRQ